MTERINGELLERTRENVRNKGGRVIYSDKNYLIAEDPISEDSHDLVINDSWIYLDRGIFKELSVASPERLKSGLEMIGEEQLSKVCAQGITIEGIGFAMAKARINVEKAYSSYLHEQLQEAKYS